MAKYVIKEDLPEVTFNDEHQFLVIDGESFGIQGKWSRPGVWGKEAMAYLAVAEYLDNLKPKLPTEPGSVIMLYKAKDWTTQAKGHFMSLLLDGCWSPLDGLSCDRMTSEEIEDWKPVQLTVVEVSP